MLSSVTQDTSSQTPNPTYSRVLAAAWGLGILVLLGVGLRVVSVMLSPPHHPLLTAALVSGLFGLFTGGLWAFCNLCSHLQRNARTASIWVRWGKASLSVASVALVCAAVLIFVLKGKL